MNENLQEKAEKIHGSATQLRGELSDKLGGLSTSIMIKAILVGVLGLCVMFWPATAFRVMLVAVAILLIIDGVVGIFGALRTNERGAFLGQSLVSLVIGGVLLLWPGASARTLMLVLGAWALLNGIMMLWSLRELARDDPYRSTQLWTGVAFALIGAVLIFWPAAGMVTVSWVIGISALVMAGVLFWLSRRMKDVKHRVDGESA